MPGPEFYKYLNATLSWKAMTRGKLQGVLYARAFHRTKTSILASVLIAFGAIPLQIAADEGHDHGSVSLDGRFTPNEDGAVFPPQPRDVSNVRTYVPSIELGDTAQIQGIKVTGGKHVEAAQAAQSSADVQVLLGDRYSLLRSARVRDKAARNKNIFRVVYFSRSENRTVVAESTDGIITNVNSYAASERQPPLGEEEKALAIDIARRYWIERDDPRVAELDGFAIQTFRSDGSLFASRVAYVSFHTQSPEPPELITWVDLSVEQVIRAGVER